MLPYTGLGPVVPGPFENRALQVSLESVDLRACSTQLPCLNLSWRGESAARAILPERLCLPDQPILIADEAQPAIWNR